MRNIGGSTLRGGQTVFHGFHMWAQLIRVALLTAAFCVVAAPAWRVWNQTTGYDWYIAMMVTVAEAKLGIGYQRDAMQTVRSREGREVVLTLPRIAENRAALDVRENLRNLIFDSAILGAKFAGLVVALMLVLFWIRGRNLTRGQNIRGVELATARQLKRRVRPAHRAIWGVIAESAAEKPHRVAGIPYPKRAETRHTIISGTTGSGKTVLISDLVSQIRDRGGRCVIYDKMGGYTRAFYDPSRDVLLNPLDGRSPRWSPFFEARGPRDFDTMAAALIPQQKDTVDPFWVTAARQLFANGAGVLHQKGVTENRILVEHLLKTDLSDLAKAMEGTVAQSIVDPDNPKTALSVRAMLTANIGALEFLPDTGNPFSIREWTADDREEGFLFLTSRGDQHASLRGLISTWLEIAVNTMLSLEQDDQRRIWVVLDELPTLHQVPSLQPGLAESRQFGGCFVLGIQVISALRDLYGRNGAETISGLCGTRVVLASPDRDTAQWSADSLGRGEVEEMSEGFSYGASTIRDGVSLTRKRELRSLALASEIMQLDTLRGWIRFPGPLPVAPIRLKWKKRPKMAERFVARPKETGREELVEDTRQTDEEAAAGMEGITKVHAEVVPDSEFSAAAKTPDSGSQTDTGSGPGKPRSQTRKEKIPPAPSRKMADSRIPLLPPPPEAETASSPEPGKDDGGAKPDTRANTQDSKKGQPKTARKADAETKHGGTDQNQNAEGNEQTGTAKTDTEEPESTNADITKEGQDVDSGSDDEGWM